MIDNTRTAFRVTLGKRNLPKFIRNGRVEDMAHPLVREALRSALDDFEEAINNMAEGLEGAEDA